MEMEMEMVDESRTLDEPPNLHGRAIQLDRPVSPVFHLRGVQGDARVERCAGIDKAGLRVLTDGFARSTALLKPGS